MLTGALRLGTRGSRLAVLQTRWVASRLRDAWPKLDCEICVLESAGDKFAATSVAALHAGQGAGVFHSALEKALLADEVDVVVASCKDIESDSPQGLQWCAVGEREEVRDVLVSQHRGLEQLPPGACLGTSSLRRQSQLSGWRGDLSFAPLRGNVNTRVEHALKASSEACDGVVVAAAGVHRLGMQAHITDYIDLEILLPAPAQGALACQYLGGRKDILRMLAPLGSEVVECCVRTERRLLANLSGGCFAPVGAFAWIEKHQLQLWGRVTSLDGQQTASARAKGTSADWQLLANEVTRQLRQQNALAIMADARKSVSAAHQN